MYTTRCFKNNQNTADNNLGRHVDITHMLCRDGQLERSTADS